MTTTAGTTSTARKMRCFNLTQWQAAAQERITLLVLPITPQPNRQWGIPPAMLYEGYLNRWGAARGEDSIPCPFRVGDVLIGRETWAIRDCGSKVNVVAGEFTMKHRLQYPATDEAPSKSRGKPYWWNKRPARSMPEWAARFRRPILSIGVRQVQTITDAEIFSMGIDPKRTATCIGGLDIRGNDETYREALAARWGRDNPGAWDANYWCWFCGVEQSQ